MWQKFSTDEPADLVTYRGYFTEELDASFVKYFSDQKKADKALDRVITDYYIGFCDSDDNSKSAAYLWRLSNLFKVESDKTTLTSRKAYIIGGLSLIRYDKGGKNEGVYPPAKCREIYNQYPDVLFGEHLLDKYPYKPIIIVDNEVKAITRAGVDFTDNWLAVGYGRSLTAGMEEKIMKWSKSRKVTVKL